MATLHTGCANIDVTVGSRHSAMSKTTREEVADSELSCSQEMVCCILLKSASVGLYASQFLNGNDVELHVIYRVILFALSIMQ
jgi:hypothetical protein